MCLSFYLPETIVYLLLPFLSCCLVLLIHFILYFLDFSYYRDVKWLNQCQLIIVMLSLISLEDAYEALRVFEILSIEKKPDGSTNCQKVVENLGSSSPKDLFYALKVNSLLKCTVNEEVFKVCYAQGIILFCTA